MAELNRKRLSALTGSANPHISGLGALVLDVAAVAPYWPRIRILAWQRRDLLKRMEGAGLIALGSQHARGKVLPCLEHGL